jgi:hypothetical protein
MEFLVPYLQYQAAPMDPQILTFARFPSHSQVDCAQCKPRFTSDLHCFLTLLEKEIKDQVKQVT